MTALPPSPFADFDTNAVGTLNFLEAARRACPEAPFVHMSTNKVYGDRPNSIRLKELNTRWITMTRPTNTASPKLFLLINPNIPFLERPK